MAHEAVTDKHPSSAEPGRARLASKLHLLPASAGPTAALLLASRGLRAFGDGLVSLLLPVYLATLGFGALDIGVLATATLAGSSVLTLGLGFVAHRFSGRALLMTASMLMAATGVAFIFAEEFWPLLLIAFVGTLNPSAGDVSLFLPLEHAQLARTVADRDRTALFARYSFVGSIAGAVGALAAGTPEWLGRGFGIELEAALQIAFLLMPRSGWSHFSSIGDCRPTYRRRASTPPNLSASPAASF